MSRQAVKEFEDLGIWMRAYELALQIYEVTAAFPAHAEPDLRTQLRRAAGAVGGHIAEGFGRYSRADYLRSLHSARGALMETRHFLHLARGLDYVAPDVAEHLVDGISRLNGQLLRTVAALRGRSSTVSLSAPGRHTSDVDN
jgi:four helix bundle protein